MFIDEIDLTIGGGNGGNGVVNFHRAKYVPKGGPDGGNGGDGGDTYIISTRNLSVFNKYRQNDKKVAEGGGDGKSGLRRGKNGEDLTLEVPIGSIVFNKDTNERFELLEEGKKVLLASGGRGGRGNAEFKSSINTTPMEATKGDKAQIYNFKISLHLIADIGIIGLPNAGKSTLLNEITNANAKVRDYPFTTIDPNLGVFHGYIIADIPGIIENASEGRGLGHKFLKHIERTNFLVHLVSCENENPLESYKLIRNELGKFNEDLLKKEELIYLSKTDLVTEEKVQELLKQMPKGTGTISIVDDVAMEKLNRNLSAFIRKSKAE